MDFAGTIRIFDLDFAARTEKFMRLIRGEDMHALVCSEWSEKETGNISLLRGLGF